MMDIKGNAIKIYSGKLQKHIYIVQDEEDRNIFRAKLPVHAVIYTTEEIKDLLAMKAIFPQAKAEGAKWRQWSI